MFLFIKQYYYADRIYIILGIITYLKNVNNKIIADLTFNFVMFYKLTF